MPSSTSLKSVISSQICVWPVGDLPFNAVSHAAKRVSLSLLTFAAVNVPENVAPFAIKFPDVVNTGILRHQLLFCHGVPAFPMNMK